MRFVSQNLFAGLLSLAVSGCANIATIDRTTLLPTHGAKHGKAVHLDIQQRLLVVNAAGKFCAEPSPDALAAYAAALGISASTSAQDAVSAAANSNFASQAAQVGLRTQTITIKRDELFNLCALAANGEIGPAHVATSLARHQDQTAVALAIEQLTGPVFTSQAGLTARASGEAESVASSVSRGLDVVREERARADERVADANQTVLSVQAQLDDINARLIRVETTKKELNTEKTRLEGELEKIPTTPPAADASAEVKAAHLENTTKAAELKADIQTLFTQITDLTADEADLDSRKKAAVERVANATEEKMRLAGRADELSRTFNELALNPNATLTTSAGRTSGLASFSNERDATKLTASAQVQVAKAVESIVKTALEKDYLTESCTSILTLSIDLGETAGFCRQLIKAKLRIEAAEANRLTALANEKIAKSKLAMARAEKETAEIDRDLKRLFSEDGQVRIAAGRFDNLRTCIAASNDPENVNSVKVEEFLKSDEIDEADKVDLRTYEKTADFMAFVSSDPLLEDQFAEFCGLAA